MSTSRVIVYSTKYCGYCHRAEALLEREGIAFESIDVTDDRRARAELIARADGRRTVPVIFIDGKPIGGYQELAALVRAGELKHISAAAWLNLRRCARTSKARPSATRFTPRGGGSTPCSVP